MQPENWISSPYRYKETINSQKLEMNRMKWSRVLSIKALPVGCLLLLSMAVTVGAESRLVDAVQEGDREAVRSLLQEHVDVNVSRADGATALAWAVHRDDLEMVELLIDAGADVNAANLYGVTPLSLACTNRNGEIVEKLLKAGADPNSAQATGETPLMTCSRAGSAQGVRSLGARGADPNATTVERGQTALMWAAAEGHSQIVQILVEQGANLQARSNRLPVYAPRVPISTQVNPRGGPVHMGFRERIYFPKFKGGFTALMFATQEGSVESIRILLAAGAEVDEGTLEEGTPLVLASANGREKAALLLLEKGAEPDATDCYGMTALHWALQEGVVALAGGHTETDPFWVHPNMTELVKALLSRGADSNARIKRDFMPYHLHRFARGIPQRPPQMSQVGTNPFLLATAAADVVAMRLLLEGGADPNLATLDGATPLMVAAGMGVELGVSGKEGVTEAVRKKALAAVQLAWQLGNDVNAEGPDGRRAVHGAALYGLTEVIQFLAEKGADLEAQDMWGQTAMSIAMADPDGFVYRNLPDRSEDFTFRRNLKKDQKTITLLLGLGASPYIPKGRDLKGF